MLLIITLILTVMLIVKYGAIGLKQAMFWYRYRLYPFCVLHSTFSIDNTC